MGEPTHAVHVHHAPKGFIRKYIFSTDHKVIGIQYYFLALFSVVLGMLLSVLFRLHLPGGLVIALRAASRRALDGCR